MSDFPFVRRNEHALRVLGRAFYQRPTIDVARDLLGKVLVRNHREGDVMLRVAEVEAYLGPDDPACHTAGGRKTLRVTSMWGEAGRAYVYLIYGMHHCLNVVTVGGGAGEAILIRGALLVAGGELVRSRRGPRVSAQNLLNGPGKICQALAVDRQYDGIDLCDDSSGLWIGKDGAMVAERAVVRTPRVGIAYAGEAASWPLRFAVKSVG